ncbi:hypothetical protein QFC22_001406 [Naganishia vaughanmartiniae]|uniref:Uncharacterized protein n=1 Tax=Naganishia vaughanmartiniae TaxID=1424756 RepID=A0ACC2XKG9_9TREE|nr:hypothetical protein QFC22_001406 [Naganishia vaughanmartiniae]
MSSSVDVINTGLWPKITARLRRRGGSARDRIPRNNEAGQHTKHRWNNSAESLLAASRITRSRRLTHRIHSTLIPWLSVLLPTLSILWLLALPLDRWGRSTYFDENAIQPGQVRTFWDWGDVRLADRWLAGIEQVWKDGNGTSEERSKYLRDELHKLNIPADTQAYTYTSVVPNQKGINTYAVISPPRASGTETIIISANWLSLSFTDEGDSTTAEDENEGSTIPRTGPKGASLPGHVSSRPGEARRNPNLRGVAEVLTFAAFLRGQNHWAKEFVIVFGDGFADGLEAFLTAYHGIEKPGLEAESLRLAPQGVVWNALNIDYPGHSFSHLGLYYENINGALPNQDLLNTIAHISQWTAGVPVQLQSLPADLQPVSCPVWMPRMGCDLLQRKEVEEYVRGAKHLVQHAKYAAAGRMSGSHGIFARYRIDAVTLFAEPAQGPHGFHALGIIMESSLRSMNNLLERLHASFFFYLLPHPGWFHKIGAYLPAAILLGAGMTFRGLGVWVDAGWETVRLGGSQEIGWKRRDRQVHVAFFIIASCLLVSWTVYQLRRYIATTDSPSRAISYSCAAITVLAPILLSRLVTIFTKNSDTSSESTRQSLHATILTTGAITRIISGALVTVLAMTNFTQAVLLGLLLFFAIEFGTWWAISCAQAGLHHDPSHRPLISGIFATIFLGVAGCWQPRSLGIALGAFYISTFEKFLFEGSSTSQAKRVKINKGFFEIYASVTLIQLVREYGFDLFNYLVAFVLSTKPDPRWDLQALLFQESAMFENRFMAQWLGIVQGLQLVGIVLLYL